MIGVATKGPVLIIGSGLLGTSIGLALRAGGVEVQLRDLSPISRALATDMGAGEPGTENSAQPQLVVVATPPDVTASCLVSALEEFPDATITDVSSVKNIILHELQATGIDLTNYVGSHPMAGRERSGAGAADADLFQGRPWVVVPHQTSAPASAIAVRTLATDLGAVPTELEPEAHDQAVALVSHAPQLVSSLLAAQLREASSDWLGLAGQGLRDMTRIAASDSRLWTAIVSGNRKSISEVLLNLRNDLDQLLVGLHSEEDQIITGVVHTISGVMTRGNDGYLRIPGKHGGVRNRYTKVCVLVPDQPGELGRLFSEIGEIGINIEDFSMEHSVKQPVGQALISVQPTEADLLEDSLEKRGWRIVNQ